MEWDLKGQNRKQFCFNHKVIILITNGKCPYCQTTDQQSGSGVGRDLTALLSKEAMLSVILIRPEGVHCKVHLSCTSGS